jgi:hypothetical protein
MVTVGQPLRLLFWQAKRLPYNFFSNYFVKNPVNGLVADAVPSFSANPISRASRPASMAFLNAFAIRTGSDAIAMAVFTSTASAPISIASAA